MCVNVLHVSPSFHTAQRARITDLMQDKRRKKNPIPKQIKHLKKKLST